MGMSHLKVKKQKWHGQNVIYILKIYTVTKVAYDRQVKSSCLWAYENMNFVPMGFFADIMAELLLLTIEQLQGAFIC
jgi:hypothetical protein